MIIEIENGPWTESRLLVDETRPTFKGSRPLNARDGNKEKHRVRVVTRIMLMTSSTPKIISAPESEQQWLEPCQRRANVVFKTFPCRLHRSGLSHAQTNTCGECHS